MTKEDILNLVADEYGVEVGDILGKCRVRCISDARKMAMYLMRECLDATPVEIGRFLGKSHTTVYLDIRKVEDLLCVDYDTRLHRDSLLRLIKRK